MNLKSRPSAIAGIVLSSALVLSACGGETDTSGLESKVTVDGGGAGAESETEPEETEPEDTPEDEPLAPAPEDEPQDDPGAAAPSGDYNSPDWAYDVNQAGELIQAVKNEWFEYEIYQVDTGEAKKDSMWLHPDSEEPVMKAGDPVVVLNVIVTNISDEEIPVSISFINDSLDYESNQYLGGAMLDYNPEWLDELGLHESPLENFSDPAVFPLAPGESFAQATIWEYRTEPATLELSFTPVDDEGTLDFDSKYGHRETVDLVLN